MTLTIAPADEACQALVTRINLGEDYALDVHAEYSRIEIDPLEELSGMRVDVVAVGEKHPAETFDDSDHSSHNIRVWIRCKIPSLVDGQKQAIAELALLRAQIAEWLDNWNSSDRRVQVWECDVEDAEQPMKDALRNASLFAASVVLRVEVQPA